jgi:hypothetical protein
MNALPPQILVEIPSSVIARYGERGVRQRLAVTLRRLEIVAQLENRAIQLPDPKREEIP